MELGLLSTAAPHRHHSDGAVRQREMVMHQLGWFVPHRTLHRKFPLKKGDFDQPQNPA